MSYAHEGVWAGAAPEAVDPQPTTEVVEPQPTVPPTGGFSDAELDALTPEEMQVAIEGGRLTDRRLTRALMALGAETTENAKQVHRQRRTAASTALTTQAPK